MPDDIQAMVAHPSLRISAVSETGGDPAFWLCWRSPSLRDRKPSMCTRGLYTGLREAGWRSSKRRRLCSLSMSKTGWRESEVGWLKRPKTLSLHALGVNGHFCQDQLSCRSFVRTRGMTNVHIESRLPTSRRRADQHKTVLKSVSDTDLPEQAKLAMFPAAFLRAGLGLVGRG